MPLTSHHYQKHGKHYNDNQSTYFCKMADLYKGNNLKTNLVRTKMQAKETLNPEHYIF